MNTSNIDKEFLKGDNEQNSELFPCTQIGPGALLLWEMSLLGNQRAQD